MTRVQRRHLKTRKSKPFNVSSKKQEEIAQVIADQAWVKLLEKYPDHEFNNLTTLGLKGLDAEFCVKYLNRGYGMRGLPAVNLEKLRAYESASGIKPDGGVFFVRARDGSFDHIIGALEVKHQGEYDGYTPISDADWRKRHRNDKEKLRVPRSQRPPQAQGNAIERFAKNANAIKTLTSFYGYNPYIVLCEGFDFYLREEYHIFEAQPYASRYKGTDSAILMRLIAGNDWMPLNAYHVTCSSHGETKICPATIMARMRKWTVREGEVILLDIIERAIKHLQAIGEV